VCLAFQLIVDKIIIKNLPTHVNDFVVDLKEKYVEGMEMNWASYLINELEKDCHKA
jgi:hypothetical protein